VQNQEESSAVRKTSIYSKGTNPARERNQAAGVSTQLSPLTSTTSLWKTLEYLLGENTLLL